MTYRRDTVGLMTLPTLEYRVSSDVIVSDRVQDRVLSTVCGQTTFLWVVDDTTKEMGLRGRIVEEPS